MSCPTCSAALPVDARFCPGCGSRVAAASQAAVSAPLPACTSGPAQGNHSPAALSAARSEVRKTVTVLFCDLVGFTPLSQRLDPEALRGLMLEYFALMRDCAERHGGVVEKYIGDAVMAVFGVPAVHEDDPLRAVRAAAEMQAALAGLSVRMFEDLGVTLGIRIGVNTGPVVAVVSPAEAGSLVAGDTVNMAARLQQHAEPGQVLLGPLTCLAVRGMADYEPTGPMTLKGIARPVTPARLVAVADGPRSAARGTDRPLVNRHSELAGLQEAFRRAERDRHCLLVTVHGDAGIGKSRLTSEFAAWASASGAIVVEGRCPGYGAGGSALALAEAVRQLLAVADEPGPDGEPARHSEPTEAREALAVLRRSLFTDGSPGLVADETAWALSQLLAQSGRSRPVVLILEDMQWADLPLLALVSEMVRRIDKTPVLVLCLGRPEFLVEHGDWSDDLPYVEFTAVGPLSESDCLQLVAGLDDITAHDAGLMARAVARAEGNPLYLEQFISASSADDLSGLADADGGGTAAAIPVGINGLIAYRLDLLRPAEREVLGLAAVCGRRFTSAGIAAAADPGAVPWHAPSHGSGQDLAAILAKLAVRRLIRPQGAPAADYLFESALVHEVAYGSLPKRWRATTHERLARWLTAESAAVSTNAEEAGTHWERAWQLRQQLGLPAAGGRHLARQGASALGEAGSRSLARGDPKHAADLLDRAVLLARGVAGNGLPADADALWLLRAGEARVMLGDVEGGRQLIAEAQAGPVQAARSWSAPTPRSSSPTCSRPGSSRRHWRPPVRRCRCSRRRMTALASRVPSPPSAWWSRAAAGMSRPSPRWSALSPRPGSLTPSLSTPPCSAPSVSRCGRDPITWTRPSPPAGRSLPPTPPDGGWCARPCCARWRCLSP